MAYFLRLLKVWFFYRRKPLWSLRHVVLLFGAGSLLWLYFHNPAGKSLPGEFYALTALVLFGGFFSLRRSFLGQVWEVGEGRGHETRKDKVRPIDRFYFEGNYGDSGRPYRAVRKYFSSSQECIGLFAMCQAPKLRKICILGTATGEVLDDFYRQFGVKPWGCEISQWAYKQTPSALKARVRRMPMEEYIPLMEEKGQKFDLVFTCALMYLEENQVRSFLKRLATLTVYLHFEGSYLGRACRDPYRKTLQTEQWWQEQFEAAGFKECLNMWGGKSFLWRSSHF